MSAPAPSPRVSVLLPVRNESTAIDACLEGILANDFPGEELEILVIDGASDDDTVERVRTWMGKHPNISLHENPQQLPYTALNIGLQHARGEFIVRVDARSIIPPNYLRECLETLESTGADNVGGVQRQFGTTPRQEAIALATGHPFGVGNAQFRLGGKSGFVDTVYLGCFRRSVFEKIGAFDEDGPVVSEDAAFNQRLRDAGGKVYLRADLTVKYPAKTSLRALARQYFIYGGAKAHVFLKYRKLTAWRQLVPLAFLGALVGSLLLGIVFRPFLWLFGVMAGVYLAVDIVVALWLALKVRRPSLAPYLVLAFPCIHFPWPVGFLVRLCEGSKPRRHWRS